MKNKKKNLYKHLYKQVIALLCVLLTIQPTLAITAYTNNVQHQKASSKTKELVKNHKMLLASFDDSADPPPDGFYYDPVCGNGVLEDIEECDDGNTVSGDGCSDLCTAEEGFANSSICGNYIVEPGEECDEGNPPVLESCSPDCKFVACGNGVVDLGEDCDDGSESAACNSDCTFATCGDYYTNAAAGEECDEGNPPVLESCSPDCKFVACGNGVVDLGEDCDDGSESATCNSDCTFAICGDYYTNTVAGEECDEGNPPVLESCSSECKFVACGNGVVEPGEDCDDGSESATCNSDCTFATCGDYYTNTAAGEECDEGNPPVLESCSPECKFVEPQTDPDLSTDIASYNLSFDIGSFTLEDYQVEQITQTSNEDLVLNISTLNHEGIEHNYIAIFTKQADNSYALENELSETTGLIIGTGDLDNNGGEDIVHLNSNGTLSFILDDGTGSLAPTGSIIIDQNTTLDSFIENAVIEDFDHDGSLDIALARNDTDKVHVLFGDGSGGFPQVSNISTNGQNPISITYNDNKLTVETEHDIFTFNNYGSREFSQESNLNHYTVHNIAGNIGDINHDGFTDYISSDPYNVIIWSDNAYEQTISTGNEISAVSIGTNQDILIATNNGNGSTIHTYSISVDGDISNSQTDSNPTDPTNEEGTTTENQNNNLGGDIAEVDSLFTESGRPINCFSDGLTTCTLEAETNQIDKAPPGTPIEMQPFENLGISCPTGSTFVSASSELKCNDNNFALVTNFQCLAGLNGQNIQQNGCSTAYYFEDAIRECTNSSLPQPESSTKGKLQIVCDSCTRCPERVVPGTQTISIRDAIGDASSVIREGLEKPGPVDFYHLTDERGPVGTAQQPDTPCTNKIFEVLPGTFHCFEKNNVQVSQIDPFDVLIKSQNPEHELSHNGNFFFHLQDQNGNPSLATAEKVYIVVDTADLYNSENQLYDNEYKLIFEGKDANGNPYYITDDANNRNVTLVDVVSNSTTQNALGIEAAQTFQTDNNIFAVLYEHYGEDNLNQQIKIASDILSDLQNTYSWEEILTTTELRSEFGRIQKNEHEEYKFLNGKDGVKVALQIPDLAYADAITFQDLIVIPKDELEGEYQPQEDIFLYVKEDENWYKHYYDNQGNEIRAIDANLYKGGGNTLYNPSNADRTIRDTINNHKSRINSASGQDKISKQIDLIRYLRQLYTVFNNQKSQFESTPNALTVFESNQLKVIELKLESIVNTYSPIAEEITNALEVLREQANNINDPLEKELELKRIAEIEAELTLDIDEYNSRLRDLESEHWDIETLNQQRMDILQFKANFRNNHLPLLLTRTQHLIDEVNSLLDEKINPDRQNPLKIENVVEMVNITELITQLVGDITSLIQGWIGSSEEASETSEADSNESTEDALTQRLQQLESSRISLISLIDGYTNALNELTAGDLYLISLVSEERAILYTLRSEALKEVSDHLEILGLSPVERILTKWTGGEGLTKEEIRGITIFPGTHLIRKIDSNIELLRAVYSHESTASSFLTELNVVPEPVQENADGTEITCGETNPWCGGACPDGQECKLSNSTCSSSCSCEAVSPCGDSAPSCNGTCPEGQGCTILMSVINITVPLPQSETIDPPFSINCACRPLPERNQNSSETSSNFIEDIFGTTLLTEEELTPEGGLRTFAKGFTASTVNRDRIELAIDLSGDLIRSVYHKRKEINEKIKVLTHNLNQEQKKKSIIEGLLAGEQNYSWHHILTDLVILTGASDLGAFLNAIAEGLFGDQQSEILAYYNLLTNSNLQTTQIENIEEALLGRLNTYTNSIKDISQKINNYLLYLDLLDKVIVTYYYINKQNKGQKDSAIDIALAAALRWDDPHETVSEAFPEIETLVNSDSLANNSSDYLKHLLVDKNYDQAMKDAASGKANELFSNLQTSLSNVSGLPLSSPLDCLPSDPGYGLTEKASIFTFMKTDAYKKYSEHLAELREPLTQYAVLAAKTGVKMDLLTNHFKEVGRELLDKITAFSFDGGSSYSNDEIWKFIITDTNGIGVTTKTPIAYVITHNPYIITHNSYNVEVTVNPNTKEIAIDHETVDLARSWAAFFDHSFSIIRFGNDEARRRAEEFVQNSQEASGEPSNLIDTLKQYLTYGNGYFPDSAFSETRWTTDDIWEVTGRTTESSLESSLEIFYIVTKNEFPEYRRIRLDEETHEVDYFSQYGIPPLTGERFNSREEAVEYVTKSQKFPEKIFALVNQLDHRQYDFANNSPRPITSYTARKFREHIDHINSTAFRSNTWAQWGTVEGVKLAVTITVATIVTLIISAPFCAATFGLGCIAALATGSAIGGTLGYQGISLAYGIYYAFGDEINREGGYLGDTWRDYWSSPESSTALEAISTFLGSSTNKFLLPVARDLLRDFLITFVAIGAGSGIGASIGRIFPALGEACAALHEGVLKTLGLQASGLAEQVAGRTWSRFAFLATFETTQEFVEEFTEYILEAIAWDQINDFEDQNQNGFRSRRNTLTGALVSTAAATIVVALMSIRPRRSANGRRLANQLVYNPANKNIILANLNRLSELISNLGNANFTVSVNEEGVITTNVTTPSGHQFTRTYTPATNIDQIADPQLKETLIQALNIIQTTPGVTVDGDTLIIPGGTQINLSVLADRLTLHFDSETRAGRWEFVNNLYELFNNVDPQLRDIFLVGAHIYIGSTTEQDNIAEFDKATFAIRLATDFNSEAVSKILHEFAELFNVLAANPQSQWGPSVRQAMENFKAQVGTDSYIAKEDEMFAEAMRIRFLDNSGYLERVGLNNDWSNFSTLDSEIQSIIAGQLGPHFLAFKAYYDIVKQSLDTTVNDQTVLDSIRAKYQEIIRARIAFDEYYNNTLLGQLTTNPNLDVNQLINNWLDANNITDPTVRETLNNYGNAVVNNTRGPSVGTINWDGLSDQDLGSIFDDIAGNIDPNINPEDGNNTNIPGNINPSDEAVQTVVNKFKIQALSSEELSNILSNFSGQDREIALEILSEISYNQHPDYLIEQLHNISSQLSNLLNGETANIVTLNPHDSGGALTYLTRRIDGPLQLSTSTTLEQVTNTNAPLVILSGFNSRTLTQSEINNIKRFHKVYIVNIRGFDIAPNLFTSNLGTDYVTNRLNELINRAKALQAQKGYSLTEGIREALNGHLAENITGLTNVEVIEHNLNLPSRDINALAEYFIGRIRNRVTAEDIANFLNRRQYREYSLGFLSSNNGLEFVTPKRLVEKTLEMKNNLEQALQNEGKTFNDVYFITGLERGSSDLITYLFQTIHGISSEQFITLDQLKDTDANVLAGKVGVYVDDNISSGKQFATELNGVYLPHHNDLQKFPLFIGLFMHGNTDGINYANEEINKINNGRHRVLIITHTVMPSIMNLNHPFRREVFISNDDFESFSGDFGSIIPISTSHPISPLIYFYMTPDGNIRFVKEVKWEVIEHRPAQ